MKPGRCVHVGQVGWCARSVVWCCCSKDKYFLFPLIWFRALESPGLLLHFFRSCALLHDGFWPSESGYKRSGKDFLRATPTSSARKANQWLSYYTFLFHRITLSVVTVPNELFCPQSLKSGTHPACFSHSQGENSLCCFSSPWKKKLFTVQFLTWTSCILLILLCPCSPRRNSYPQGPC